MKKIGLSVILLLGLLSMGFADGGGEAKPLSGPSLMKMYKVSEPMLSVPGKTFRQSDFLTESEVPLGDYNMQDVFLSRLSRDSFSSVVAYYKKMMSKQDTLEETTAGPENDFMHVVRITYQNIYPEFEEPAATVEIRKKDMAAYQEMMQQYGGWEVIAATLLPYPLSLMRNQVGMHGHTQEEFDRLVTKYAYLGYALFTRKMVEGQEMSESDLILAAFINKVYGIPDNIPQDQYEAYVQKASMKPGFAQRLFAKEVWDLGLTALQELEKKAYGVMIEHTGIDYWE